MPRKKRSTTKPRVSAFSDKGSLTFLGTLVPGLYTLGRVF